MYSVQRQQERTPVSWMLSQCEASGAAGYRRKRKRVEANIQTRIQHKSIWQRTFVRTWSVECISCDCIVSVAYTIHIASRSCVCVKRQRQIERIGRDCLFVWAMHSVESAEVGDRTVLTKTRNTLAHTRVLNCKWLSFCTLRWAICTASERTYEKKITATKMIKKD